MSRLCLFAPINLVLPQGVCRLDNTILPVARHVDSSSSICWFTEKCASLNG